jgi:4-amino-4-deoxy-L-arabinose transferase-like glycosyltransferase
MTTDPSVEPTRTARAGGHSELPAALLLVLVMATFAASRLVIAGVPSEREYDEGVYLLSARAVAAGQQVFTEVFSSQPPAFVETLALAFRLLGDRLDVARGVILAFALLAMTAVASIARHLSGPMAAPAAAAALALTMTFGDLAHVVEAETPALALGLAALAVCLESRRRRWHRGWLLASGAIFGLAALFKLIVVPLAAPFGLLLLTSEASGDDDRWRVEPRAERVAARAFTAGLGALLVLGVSLLLYDAGAFYEQVVGFHLSKHDVFDLNWLSNLARVGGHFRADAAMVATAAAGLLLMANRQRGLAASWLTVWLVTMIAALAMQTPIFWRHFVLLSPPIAVAAGVAVVLAAGTSRRRQLAAVLVAITCWTAVTLHNDRGIFPLLSDGARSEKSLASLTSTAGWIESNTVAGELVASDDPLAVYLAGRRSPAGLCDTSTSRIVAGSLKVEDAARESLHARVIVLRRGGRLSSLPGYVGWLKRNYDYQPKAVSGLETNRVAWIRKPGATAVATNPR